MSASLGKPGLPPRPNITIAIVDRETVRAIVHSEMGLCKRAIELGIDVDEAHRGYAPYIDDLMSPMSEEEKQEFQRLLVEETLNYAEPDKAPAEAIEVGRHYAEVPEQPKPLSSGRVFMAGVNVTILIGIALFWAFK